LSGLFAQIKAFSQTLILGILVGVIFHYYHLVVSRARIGKYSLYILDFLLWIFMVFVVFMSMLLINLGEMRLYILIALLTGILIYYYFFSHRLKNFLSTAAQVTINIFSALVKNTKKPFVLILRQIKIAIKSKRDLPDDGDGKGQ